MFLYRQRWGKVAFVGNINTFICWSYNLLDTQVYYFTQAGVVSPGKGYISILHSVTTIPFSPLFCPVVVLN
jgi:hypothetical protein